MGRLQIGIYGAGALGSLLAAYLSIDHDVFIYGRQNHLKAIKEKGLLVSGIDEGKYFNIKLGRENQNYDLLFVAVKQYDTEKSLQEINSLGINFSFIASVQNGLKDDKLIKKFGKNRVLGCAVNEAAKFAGPGHVCYVNQGHSYFGLFEQEENKDKEIVACALVAALRKRGMRTGVNKKMNLLTWYKFLGSVMGSAVSGALNVDVKKRYSLPESQDLVVNVVKEISEIAAAEKVILEKHPLLDKFFLAESDIERKERVRELNIHYSQQDYSHIPSLLQDLRRGKPKTEASDLIGVMLRKGKNHKLNLPALTVCYNKIKEWEFKNQMKVSTSS